MIRFKPIDQGTIQVVYRYLFDALLAGRYGQIIVAWIGVQDFASLRYPDEKVRTRFVPQLLTIARAEEGPS